MKLTSYDLQNFGIIDELIKEPKVGIENDFESVTAKIKTILIKQIQDIQKLSTSEMLEKRYEKYRNM